MITKKKFIETYANHPPKKWIKFAFKYFSKETEAKNMKLADISTKLKANAQKMFGLNWL